MIGSLSAAIPPPPATTATAAANAIVASVFQQYLGRSPSPNSTFALAMSAGHLSEADLIQQLVNSPEYKSDKAAGLINAQGYYQAPKPAPPPTSVQSSNVPTVSGGSTTSIQAYQASPGIVPIVSGSMIMPTPPFSFSSFFGSPIGMIAVGGAALLVILLFSQSGGHHHGRH